MSDGKTKLPSMFRDACLRTCEAMDRYATDPERFWNCADELLATMPEYELEEGSEQWPLHFFGLRVVDEVTRYDNRDREKEIYESPQKVFEAVHAVHEELHSPFLKKRYTRPSQTIAQLLKEGVAEYQICVEWGFVDEHGRPDLEKFDKEVSEPGSVIDKGWMHPKQVKFERQRLEYRREYESLLRSFYGTEEDPLHDEVVVPESLEDLYRQGVEAWQTAKILGKSEAEIHAKYEELAEAGVPSSVMPVTTRNGETMSEYKPMRPEEPEGIDESYEDDPRDAMLEASEWDRDAAQEKYAAWTTVRLKEHCKDIGVPIRGNLSDEKIIERILDDEEARAIEEVSAE